PCIGRTAMRPDRYTVKSQEAIERAQQIARENGHQELAPEHLLAALLEDEEGTTAALLEKLGVPREPLVGKVEAALGRKPRVTGGGPSLYLGESLREALESAETRAAQLKDEF